MGLWDFVKEAGKSVFGEAEAAEPKVQPAHPAGAAPAPTPAPQAAPAAPAPDADTQRKLDALNAEVKAIGLDASKVHRISTATRCASRTRAPTARRWKS